MDYAGGENANNVATPSSSDQNVLVNQTCSAEDHSIGLVRAAATPVAYSESWIWMRPFLMKSSQKRLKFVAQPLI